MKVWVTRPSIWDCLVKGIGRCEMWFVKPVFDRTPRGDSDLPIFSHLPRGWRALGDDGLDAQDAISLQVGKTLKEHPALAEQLWTAVCASIEGAAPCADDDWVKHWQQLISEDKDTGDTTFLFELELPPMLWFQIAQQNGFENGTWAARHYRYLLSSDLPF